MHRSVGKKEIYFPLKEIAGAPGCFWLNHFLNQTIAFFCATTEIKMIFNKKNIVFHKQGL